MVGAFDCESVLFVGEVVGTILGAIEGAWVDAFAGNVGEYVGARVGGRDSLSVDTLPEYLYYTSQTHECNIDVKLWNGLFNLMNIFLIQTLQYH